MNSEALQVLDGANRHMIAGELDQAEPLLREFIGSHPDNGQALFNMGVIVAARAKTGADLVEAVEWYERCIDAENCSEKTKSEAANNIGTICSRTGEHRKAFQAYMFAVQIDPSNIAARRNYAEGLRHFGQFKEAMGEYERLLGDSPSDATVRMQAGMVALLLGDFERGWAEYDHRFDVPEFPTKKFVSDKPMWNGEDLNGKRILLTGEQGFGDNFQFIRYANLLADMGADVWFCGYQSIQELFETVRGVSKAVCHVMDEEFDYHCPILSVPHRLGTVIETIPSECPYIFPPTGEGTAGIWQGYVNVGIVWAGSPRHGKDKFRSIEPEAFQPMIDANQGINWHSFQCGPRAEEVKRLRDVHDRAPFIATWMDTARLLKRMDLLITVDTACAHLAGAIGVPAWILIPHSPDWRWLLGRTDSPWYPLAKLFRQPAQGDWETPLRAIVKELEAL